MSHRPKSRRGIPPPTASYVFDTPGGDPVILRTADIRRLYYVSLTEALVLLNTGRTVKVLSVSTLLFAKHHKEKLQ